MEGAVRFREFLLSSSYCGFVIAKNFGRHICYMPFRRTINMETMTALPELPLWWTQYRCMMIKENNFKMKLLHEFITECKINKSASAMHNFEKALITQTSIATLMKQNLVPNVDSVVNGLLSVLEKFPFDRTRIVEDENILTLRHIRNAVELQYLAWKYKVDLPHLENILNRFRLCLYEFRSITNLRRSIDMLEKSPKAAHLCVSEKIYHLNQKPFYVTSVRKFKDTIVGLNWQLLPLYSPKILKHSHQYILFCTSVLTSLNFTDEQIQNGLPFLYISFDILIKRLNQILTNTELIKHRDDEKFLCLLSYPVNELHDLINSRKASYVELTDLITFSSKGSAYGVKFTSVNHIMYHVNCFFTVDNNRRRILMRHSKYRLACEKQIRDTLDYLKRGNFKDSEIAECLTIVLYPRDLIERGLQKISSETETLKKCGLVNGCVDQPTNYFRNGTKEKQKTLQLCLYYMEKPHHFSGDGVWDYNADSEKDAVSGSSSCI